jgi:lactoylglutathione lyase
MEKVCNNLNELGATENKKPYHVGGGLMTATVKDPWENMIGIMYNPEIKLKAIQL